MCIPIHDHRFEVSNRWTEDERCNKSTQHFYVIKNEMARPYKSRGCKCYDNIKMDLK